VNYFDPDGRCDSPVYETIKSSNLLSLVIRPFWNNLASISTKLGLTSSFAYEVGSFDPDKGAIGFINGIQNTPEDAFKTAHMFSQYAGGAKIHGVYNATHHGGSMIPGLFDAVTHAICATTRIHTPPVQLLKNQWDFFIKTRGPDEKFLQICHSGGAIQVLIALLDSPKEVRDRIIVLAISPGAIVPKKLCFYSENYASEADFVPRIDYYRQKLGGHANELIFLKRHPDANVFDHGIQSPTFQPSIRNTINKHMSGGK